MKESTKKLGIWMDHTIAHLYEIKNKSMTSNTLESIFLQSEKQNFGRDESLKQNTEQNQDLDFYKRLGEVIKEYSEVFLFGPTNAKKELFNLLREDTQYNEIKFELETTDKLTENQMHAFVKEHFERDVS